MGDWESTLNKSTIIRQLRKWSRAKGQAGIDEQKLMDFIDKYQGRKEQDDIYNRI